MGVVMVLGAAACELALDLGPYEAGCASGDKACADPANGGRLACLKSTRVDIGCGEPGCGSCASRIPNGAQFGCSPSGACIVSNCVTPYQTCDGTTCNSDSMTDSQNCGGCSAIQGSTFNCTTWAGPNVQAMGFSCLSGNCKVVLCNAGWADCDDDPTNGCEVALSGANCWSCPQRGAPPSQRCPCASCPGRPFACPACAMGADTCDEGAQKCVAGSPEGGPG